LTLKFLISIQKELYGELHFPVALLPRKDRQYTLILEQESGWTPDTDLGGLKKRKIFPARFQAPAAMLMRYLTF